MSEASGFGNVSPKRKRSRNAGVQKAAAQCGQRSLGRFMPRNFVLFQQRSPTTTMLDDAHQSKSGRVYVLRQHDLAPGTGGSPVCVLIMTPGLLN